MNRDWDSEQCQYNTGNFERGFNRRLVRFAFMKSSPKNQANDWLRAEMVSSALLLWFILPFAVTQEEHQQQQAEAYQTALALYFLSFSTSFFFFLFLSVLCIRWRRSRQAVTRVESSILIHVVRSVPTSGVDENLIKSLPLLQFSTLGCSSDGPVECSICLSKFESTDVVRVLPKCNHTFHVQCIDQWLPQHSNCPVCRQKVEVQDFPSSIHLHETQSSYPMEEGTIRRPIWDSLNGNHGGTTVNDNVDAQTPVWKLRHHSPRRHTQQVESYVVKYVYSEVTNSYSIFATVRSAGRAEWLL